MNAIYAKFRLELRFSWFELDRLRTITPFLTQTYGSVTTAHWRANIAIRL